MIFLPGNDDIPGGRALVRSARKPKPYHSEERGLFVGGIDVF